MSVFDIALQRVEGGAGEAGAGAPIEANEDAFAATAAHRAHARLARKIVDEHAEGKAVACAVIEFFKYHGDERFIGHLPPRFVQALAGDRI